MSNQNYQRTNSSDGLPTLLVIDNSIEIAERMWDHQTRAPRLQSGSHASLRSGGFLARPIQSASGRSYINVTTLIE
jgi:hypothetical protein